MQADSDSLHCFCFAVKMFQVTFVTGICKRGVLRRLLLHSLHPFSAALPLLSNRNGLHILSGKRNGG